MNFEMLLDRAIKKAATTDTALKTETFSGPPVRFDADRAHMLTQFLDKGQIDSPYTAALRTATDRARDVLTRARAAGLSGKELNIAREKARSLATATVERAKLSRLQAIFKALDERQKAYAAERSAENLTRQTADLLRLQRLQLQHALTDESAAVARLAEMHRTGYTDDERLILRSKGKRAAERADALAAELPPHLADGEGVRLLTELAELVEAGTGVVPYRVKGAPISERISVGEILDLSLGQPTAAEALAGVSAEFTTAV